MLDRRQLLSRSSGALAGLGLGLAGAPRSANQSSGSPPPARPEPLFKLSLAQWSLHRSLGRGAPATMTDLEFAKVAQQLGFGGIEYVNQFFQDKARDSRHIAALKRAARDHGVRSLLIMCDGEGALGAPDGKARARAVENHYRWVEAARLLGCHSIRVNARSSGTRDEQMKLAADGLQRLTAFADLFDINVLVENHGGLSSDGGWLVGVMRLVDHKRCGTLPDFGNFALGQGKEYDRYRGVRELMPYAKAVSAKSHDFDDQGDETHTDYLKMLKIVVDAGYRGFVGVEYEGRKLSEIDGIIATRRLLERVRDRLAKRPG
jgi:sugar phosphate isomerase/epimerase